MRNTRVQLSIKVQWQMRYLLQGGEDSLDPLSLYVIFRKSDLHLVVLLWKMICILGDPMGLRHPVARRDVSCLNVRLLMGWLRGVGDFKLYVFFAEHRLFYRALLQKRPIILRRLLIVATPYVSHAMHATHCNSVLQCVAVCCSVLQCVAV